MTRPKYSMAELRAKAQREPETFYDRVFTRHLSIWITRWFAPLGVTPNAISLLNLWVGLAACALVGFAPTVEMVVFGVVLIHLYAVLDSVDGELARLLDRKSIKGMFLEDLSAYTMAAAFPVAVGLYLFRAADMLWALVIGVLFAVLGRNAMPAVRRAIAQSPPDSKWGKDEVERGPLPDRTTGWKRTLDRTVLHPTNVRVVLSSLILIGLAAGAPGSVVGPVFLAYMLAMLAREVGILHLALNGDLIAAEAVRMRVGGQRRPPLPPAQGEGAE